MTKSERQKMLQFSVGAWLVWGWLIKSTDTQTTIKIEDEMIITADEKYDIRAIRFFAKDISERLMKLAKNDCRTDEATEQISTAALYMSFVLMWLEETTDNKTILTISKLTAPRGVQLGDYDVDDAYRIGTDVENGLLEYMENHTATKNSRIMRCPFCGSEAELGQEKDSPLKEFYVRCKQTETCGATAAFVKDKKPASNFDSILLWNKRVGKNNVDRHHTEVSFFPEEAKEKIMRIMRQKKAYLEPCPFCGSRSLMIAEFSQPLDLIGIDETGKEIYRKEGEGGEESWLSVQCMKCFAGVYFTSAETEESEADVIDRWNRRNGE